MTVHFLVKNLLNSTKRTFQDVFGSNYQLIEYNNSQYTETFDASPYENIFVHDSVFINISSNSCGGAIYCSRNIYRLLIEQTTFISCTTSDIHGGGIYLSSAESGECILLRVCAYSCSSVNSTKSEGQFAYFSTNNKFECKNHVNDSSVTSI